MTGIIFLIVLLALTPLFLTFTVGKEHVERGFNNVTLYTITHSSMARAHNGLLVKVMFLWTSCFLKLFPCVSMTILSILLTRKLNKSARRTRLRMQRHGSDRLSVKSKESRLGSGGGSRRPSTTSSRIQERDQKTRMLLVMLVFYLISVLPFGIGAPLTGILGREFKINVFDPLFLLFDMIALVTSLTVFILLVSMSRLFRETIYKIFWPTCWKPATDPHVRIMISETSTVSSPASRTTADNYKTPDRNTPFIPIVKNPGRASVSSLVRVVTEIEHKLKYEC